MPFIVILEYFCFQIKRTRYIKELDIPSLLPFPAFV